MDSTMNSLPKKAILGAGAAVLSAVLAAALGSVPLAFGMISAVAVAYVTLMAHSERLRGEERLVYRPVYARRHDVRYRVRSDD